MAPFCVGHLGPDGEWRVLMHVPLPEGAPLARVDVALSANEAESLARQLNEYAQLLRERTGLPGGGVWP
jgi:hypothetical protein